MMVGMLLKITKKLLNGFKKPQSNMLCSNNKTAGEAVIQNFN